MCFDWLRNWFVDQLLDSSNSGRTDAHDRRMWCNAYAVLEQGCDIGNIGCSTWRTFLHLTTFLSMSKNMHVIMSTYGRRVTDFGDLAGIDFGRRGVREELRLFVKRSACTGEAHIWSAPITCCLRPCNVVGKRSASQWQLKHKAWRDASMSAIQKRRVSLEDAWKTLGRRGHLSQNCLEDVDPDKRY